MKLNVKRLVIILIVSVVLFGIGSFAGIYVSTSGLNILDVSGDQLTTQNSVSNYQESKSIIEDSLDGVVTVYVSDNGTLQSQGSGFVYKDSYIMTNEHVVNVEDKQNTTYYVQYRNGEWSEISIVGTNVDTDIAVGKPESMPSYVKSLVLSENTPEIGSGVAALGSPEGLENSVTMGIISATERAVQVRGQYLIPDTIQTDAALNNGNSGGPLVSLDDGEVVGVNRAKEGDNIGFAVSSQMANQVGQSLIEDGQHRNPLVGISTVELNPTIPLYNEVDIESGLIVVDTVEGTPGYDSFQTGANDTNPDIITKIGDRNVTDNEDVSGYLLTKKQPGDEVTFEIYRDGEKKTISIVLSSREQG